MMTANSNSFRLDDKLAVVTGGASGIGRAVARRFAGRGACVTVLDIDESAAAVAKEIETDGGKAKAYPCDVSELESVKTSFQEIFAAGKNRISREMARLLAEQSGQAGRRRRMGHDASNGG